MQSILQGRTVCAPAIVLRVRQRSPSGASRHLPRIGEVCLTEGAFLLSAKGLPHHDLDLHGGPGGGGGEGVGGDGLAVYRHRRNAFFGVGGVVYRNFIRCPAPDAAQGEAVHLVGEAGVNFQPCQRGLSSM